MERSLNGIKVVDMSRVVAGPVCGSILGDLGADVIKVEGPDKFDEIRSWYTRDLEDISLYYMSVNRNKRAITLNLKSKKGIEIAKELLKDADVVIENFKTGTMKRLGLGYDELKEINPGLIYCSVTGYGQNGPYKDLPGYDFLAQAMGGAMSVNGPKTGDPFKTGIAMADLFTGLYATISVLASLQARNHTHSGQHSDISLLDSMVASMLNIATSYLNTGALPERYGNEHPNLVPYQNFHTKDQQIIVAIGNDNQFKKLCILLGVEKKAYDERFSTASARSINREELIPIIQNKLLERSAKEWIDMFRQNNIPSGPINTMEEVFADPQVIARKMTEEISHPTLGSVNLLSSPIKLSETPAKIEKHPPLPGEHTDEVLKELDYDEDQIEVLYKNNII